MQIFKSKLPFDLSMEENLMTINIKSVNQTIHYSIICKNTDNFSRIENCLYEKYPNYKKTNNYLLFNGTTVDPEKTLDYNKIKDNDLITLYIVEDSFKN